MSDEGQARSLSGISTLWTVVCRAQGGSPEDVAEAQRLLLLRYWPSVRRYLLGALRDPSAADELAQEFALRFCRGDFKGARPEKGRFRNFLKGVLSHLIADHHRRRARDRQVPEGVPEPAADTAEAAATLDREFQSGWRAQLLAAAWEGLAGLERRTGQPLHAVLRQRADRPDLNSGALAEQLTRLLGKSVTAAWVRQNLHRAREKFADLLIEEVAQTLVSPGADDLEQELIELELYEHCRAAVARYRAAGT